mgnify:CR=1 FL=1
MTVGELKKIIKNIDNNVEVVCLRESIGEIDFEALIDIEYNEENDLLTICIDD